MSYQMQVDKLQDVSMFIFFSWKETVHISFFSNFSWSEGGIELAIPGSAVECFTTEANPLADTELGGGITFV